MKRLGRFGEFAKDYEKARRPHHLESLKFLKANIKIKQPVILDLGCGTGISTRQLAKLGKVTGCDPDPLMLSAAKKHKRINSEKYVIGKAECLPFKDSSFDVVTAFSAFHWFNNKKGVSEIKRVLKPDGIIFIVNKTGIRSWGEGYRRTIIKSIQREVAGFKEDSYNPKSSLVHNGIKRVKVKSWKHSELFIISNALEYVQSVSIWNSVPAKLRPKAMIGLKKYFTKLKKNKGKIERKITTTAVMGFKK